MKKSTRDMACRVRDVVLAGSAIVVLAPLMLCVSAAVRLDSAGSVLYRQQRVGIGGGEFTIYKFRTMKTGSKGPGITSSADSRVTRTGRWLRLLKIDEFPQLINVLKGEMSLVGPRPELREFVQHWSERDRHVILSVRPGITDPASVAFRHESEMLAGQLDPESYYIMEILPRKAEIYVNYVLNRTFLGDLRILVETVGVVLGTAAWSHHVGGRG